MADDTNEDYLMNEVKRIERRFDAHLLEEQAYKEAELLRQKSQDEAYARCMEGICKLTEATKDVVDAWKVANGFQRFIKWLSGFAFLGLALDYLVKHFK